MDKRINLKIIGDRSDSLASFIKHWDDEREYIVAHTSGSTGVPKRICLYKRDMLISAQRTISYFNLNRNSVLGLPLSVEYIAGKMMVVRALCSQSMLWIEKPSNMPLSNYQLDQRIDLLAVVPSQVDYLIDSEKISVVDKLLIGGAPLSSEQERLLLAKEVDAYVSYGMTETCSHVAIRKIGEDFYRALPGIEFSCDRRGCLVVDCGDMSIGRLSTNDVIDLTDNTSFKWLGRVDNVINSGGIKFHPEQLERRILKLMENASYYFTSRQSKRWGQELILKIQKSDLANENEKSDYIAKIRHKLELELHNEEMPKAIIIEPEFHYTENGKLIRQ